MDENSDPIVEILRLAYRRGLAIRQQQQTEGPPSIDDKVDPTRDAINKEKAFKFIDGAEQALRSLQQAITEGNSRIIDIELRTVRQKLANIVELVAMPKEKQHDRTCKKRIDP